MIDFLSFIFTQFSNIFVFLDSFELVENLSLLRIIFIVILLKYAIKFLFPSKEGQ